MYYKFYYSQMGYRCLNNLNSNKKILNHYGHHFVIVIRIVELRQAADTQLQENIRPDICDLLDWLPLPKSDFSIYSDSTPSCKLGGRPDQRKTNHYYNIIHELVKNDQTMLTKLQTYKRKNCVVN